MTKSTPLPSTLPSTQITPPSSPTPNEPHPITSSSNLNAACPLMAAPPLRNDLPSALQDCTMNYSQRVARGCGRASVRPQPPPFFIAPRPSLDHRWVAPSFTVQLINFHPICFKFLAPIKEPNEFCPSSVVWIAFCVHSLHPLVMSCSVIGFSPRVHWFYVESGSNIGKGTHRSDMNRRAYWTLHKAAKRRIIWMYLIWKLMHWRDSCGWF